MCFGWWCFVPDRWVSWVAELIRFLIGFVGAYVVYNAFMAVHEEGFGVEVPWAGFIFWYVLWWVIMLLSGATTFRLLDSNRAKGNIYEEINSISLVFRKSLRVCLVILFLAFVAYILAHNPVVRWSGHDGATPAGTVCRAV